MRNLLLGVSILLCGFQALRASESGAVSGHVFCSDSHTPCRFASVVIESVPPKRSGSSASPATQSHSYSAVTDIEGAFQIRGVAPGEYYILGQLAGYLSPYDLAASEFQGDSSLASQALDAALVRISVESNQTTISSLTLSRGAAIGGTVRFDDGGVAIHIPVRLFRRDHTGGWKPYENTAGASSFASLGFVATTDDRGRFYEPGLPPGAYIVGASLPDATVIPTVTLGRQSMDAKMTSGSALRVFNGDKYRLKDATPINLREGDSRLDVDINLPTSGLHSVRGFVTAKSDGHSIPSGTVRLLDPDDKTMLREAPLQQDGSFDFEYVAAGSYLVQVDPKPDGRKEQSAAYESLAAPLLVETDIWNLAYSLTAATH
jgi:hypothetical protein